MTGQRAHAVAVVLSAAVLTGLMLTVQATADPTEFIRAPADWSPSSSIVGVCCLGLLAIAAASYQPLVGVLIIFAFEYGVPRYTPEYQFMLQLRIPEVAAALTLSGWLVWRRQQGLAWPPIRVLEWGMAALVGWVIVSAIVAALSNQPWQPSRTQHPSRFGVAAIAFLVSAHGLRSQGHFVWAAFALGGCVLVRALLTPGGVTLDGDVGALVAIATPLLAIPLVIGRITTRTLATLVTAGLLIVLALTRNRGGAVGLAAAGLALVILAPSWRLRALAVIPLALALLVPLTNQQYAARFAELVAGGVRVGSAGERLMIWEAADQMIADHPVTGVGPGNFAARVGSYRPGLARMGPHNTVLAMFAETGIVGGTIFVLLFGAALFLAASTAWWTKGWTAVAAMAIGSALVGYLVAGMFVGRQTQVVGYVLLGAVSALKSRYSTGP
jgi:hypothetical protein